MFGGLRAGSPARRGRASPRCCITHIKTKLRAHMFMTGRRGVWAEDAPKTSLMNGLMRTTTTTTTKATTTTHDGGGGARTRLAEANHD